MSINAVADTSLRGYKQWIKGTQANVRNVALKRS